jgi:vacuolar-type H+-ATPase subunit I/STV1
VFRFYELPIWLFGTIIVGSTVLIAVGGLILFQRVVVDRLGLTEEMNNDVIFFASAIGVFYSLTVGLIAVGVWTTYTEAMDFVSAEAAAIAALYRDVSGYPEPTRNVLQAELRAYTEQIITREWPVQARGGIFDAGTRLLTTFETNLYGFEPQTLGQHALHAETLREFNQLITLRRLRIDSVEGDLPNVMWWVVLFGAILTIGVTYLLKIQPRVHQVLTAMFALFVGLVIFVIASLDQPLSGPLMISPEPYQVVLDRLIDLR